MSLQAISFDLQITPGSIPPVLHMSQYDSGRQFTAYLKDETNTAFTPGTGATAKIKGFNAAGVAWEQAATVDGSTVVFTPSGAATDQFGVMPVTIEITVGEEVLTPLLVVFDIQRAGYTNEEAVRSPEFQTAIEAAVAAAIEEGGLGFSDEFKEALLACIDHVAWDNTDGQEYIDALYDALNPGPSPVTLVSITADYEQDRPVYADDDLSVLKTSDDLTVTAHYSDGTTAAIEDDDYTLTGTLTAGTSTITVSYDGKTDTFDVTVTAPLYSVPDFAAQTVTVTNGTLTVSKTNDVYTLTGKSTGVAYIYPNGTFNTSKSNTAWFDIAADTTVKNVLFEIEWTNPNTVGVSLNAKFAKSDSTGNVFTTAYSMAASGSGSGATAEAEFTPPDIRHISCIALQFLRDSGSGALTTEPTVSFKIKVMVDGVRYL